jgi:hypothetical protein
MAHLKLSAACPANRPSWAVPAPGFPAGGGQPYALVSPCIVAAVNNSLHLQGLLPASYFYRFVTTYKANLDHRIVYFVTYANY